MGYTIVEFSMEKLMETPQEYEFWLEQSGFGDGKKPQVESKKDRREVLNAWDEYLKQPNVNELIQEADSNIDGSKLYAHKLKDDECQVELIVHIKEGEEFAHKAFSKTIQYYSRHKAVLGQKSKAVPKVMNGEIRLWTTPEHAIEIVNEIEPFKLHDSVAHEDDLTVPHKNPYLMGDVEGSNVKMSQEIADDRGRGTGKYLSPEEITAQIPKLMEKFVDEMTKQDKAGDGFAGNEVNLQGFEEWLLKRGNSVKSLGVPKGAKKSDEDLKEMFVARTIGGSIKEKREEFAKSAPQVFEKKVKDILSKPEASRSQYNWALRQLTNVRYKYSGLMAMEPTKLEFEAELKYPGMGKIKIASFDFSVLQEGDINRDAVTDTVNRKSTQDRRKTLKGSGVGHGKYTKLLNDPKELNSHVQRTLGFLKQGDEKSGKDDVRKEVGVWHEMDAKTDGNKVFASVMNLLRENKLQQEKEMESSLSIEAGAGV